MSAQVIWNYFKSKGFNDYGVAGLMGNLYAESGLSPTNLQNTYEKKLGMNDSQYTAAVDSGRYTNFIHDSAGYGLAQWTYWSRKEKLLTYCRSQNKSIGDLEAQLDFLYQELTTSFPQVVKILKTAASVAEASNAVLLQFERPANKTEENQQRRAQFGQTYYNQFCKGGNGGMKYGNSNKPLVCMQTTSTCYTRTTTMKVKGVLIHSTGANNPTIKRYVQPSDNAPDRQKMLQIIGVNNNRNDWNHKYVEAGLNAWIGKLADGTVATVQTMPWNYRPWGCGSGKKGSCNDGWIQFEICEDALTDRNYFNAAYNEMVELVAYLCQMYNLNPYGTVTHNGIKVPVILCHQDSARLGLGSNHSDIYNWFPKFGKSMDDVRNDVAALLNTPAPAPTPDVPVNYQAKVVATAGLNCRTTPVTGAVLMVYPYQAVLTIMKENNGWGYTGKGWVSLEYIEKVEDDDDMTQEKFNEMMNNYLADLAKQTAAPWSAADRAWAEQTGLIKGDGTGNMRYKSFLTREEVAALLHRYNETFG